MLAGCSSSRAPQPEAETDDAPTGPPYALLYVEDAEIVLHDARTDSTQTLVADARFAGARAASPTGDYLAFSYATADSTHLALLDLQTLALTPLHARAGTATYSLAWHPEGDRLAFAFYAPTAEGGRGPGGVRLAALDGTTRSVGCRAAREVLGWLHDGSLATRDDDNLYVVAPDDCATRAAVDARRMHHLAYAPDGRRLAYVHRALRYDRSAGAYVPDSTLRVSDARGQAAEELFGDDRRVRHLRWSPASAELAFDMASAETGHRQIVVYNAEQDRPVYLIPPEQAPDADQVHPRWSRGGSHLAFTLRDGNGATAAVQVEGQTRRLGPTVGPVWGWIDDRALVVRGPDSLRVKTLQGTTRYAHPAPAALIHAWQRPAS